jgi:uncharacterized membrane protein YhaH (DUF805 family)
VGYVAMGYISIWHWFFVLVFLPVVALIIWMMVRVAHKAGYSGWWVVLMLVPLLNLITLWVFAFTDWPALRERAWSASTRR